MNYTPEDAISLTKLIKDDTEKWGPDTVFDGLKRVDPELLALTVMLTALSR